MNTGMLIWLVIFAIFALCFFAVAAVVSIKGIADLRSLLQHSKREE